MPGFLKRRLPFSISPAWLIVAGVALVLFGGAGSRFSFGVFLKPLTDEFGWSRSSMVGALAIAGLATGLLRPVAGWLSDRFDPVRVAVAGMILAGFALLALARVNHLWQLYAAFFALGLGFTLASPATLTKLVSAVFSRRRGLALSLAGSGSAVGETALVPLSAVVLAMSGWRSAYLLLGAIVLLVILPLSLLLLRARRRVVNADADQERTAGGQSRRDRCAWMPDQGLGLRAALKTKLFWALTAGYFT